jgi:hypothetical protein
MIEVDIKEHKSKSRRLVVTHKMSILRKPKFITLILLQFLKRSNGSDEKIIRKYQNIWFQVMSWDYNCGATLQYRKLFLWFDIQVPQLEDSVIPRNSLKILQKSATSFRLSMVFWNDLQGQRRTVRIAQDFKGVVLTYAVFLGFTLIQPILWQV